MFQVKWPSRPSQSRETDLRPLLIAAILCLSSLASARSYTTNFPATETPICESSNWINGGNGGGGACAGIGLDWANVDTSSGFAYGTQVGNETCPSNCNDSTAVVSGSWGADQTCQATVYLPSAPAGGVSEVECRLRTTITAHSITGYEINCSVGVNHYIQIVRWNGTLGSFTQLAANNTTSCVANDVLKATIVGTTITAFLNGTQMTQITDSTYSTGSPGIGFYLGSITGINTTYGLSSVTLSDTVSSTRSTMNGLSIKGVAFN